MSITPKKLIIFFSGLAVFVVLMVAGANLALKRLVPEDRGERTPLPAIRDGQAPAEIPEGATKIVEPATVADTRPIIYTAAGFEPAETTIKSSDAYGCLVSVVNRSAAKIKVGVGPHAAAGDPGSDYGELAPNEIGIYDVRYPGFEAVTLHNHFQPQQQFKVVYGEGCR